MGRPSLSFFLSPALALASCGVFARPEYGSLALCCEECPCPGLLLWDGGRCRSQRHASASLPLRTAYTLDDALFDRCAACEPAACVLRRSVSSVRRDSL
ncbi:hypothetical protein ZWY2020_002085 [Hordeum vulgare]|nr:hypothetical protein ZWY2020_002085 [Hordeum vulgare]